MTQHFNSFIERKSAARDNVPVHCVSALASNASSRPHIPGAGCPPLLSTKKPWQPCRNVRLPCSVTPRLQQPLQRSRRRPLFNSQSITLSRLLQLPTRLRLAMFMATSTDWLFPMTTVHEIHFPGHLQSPHRRTSKATISDHLPECLSS
jgi:hypothetical protein